MKTRGQVLNNVNQMIINLPITRKVLFEKHNSMMAAEELFMFYIDGCETLFEENLRVLGTYFVKDNVRLFENYYLKVIDVNHFRIKNSIFVELYKCISDYSLFNSQMRNFIKKVDINIRTKEDLICQRTSIETGNPYFKND